MTFLRKLLWRLTHPAIAPAKINQPTRFLGGRREWALWEGRTCIVSTVRLMLQRELTEDEKWLVDGFVDKLTLRSELPNMLLQSVVERENAAKSRSR